MDHFLMFTVFFATLALAIPIAMCAHDGMPRAHHDFQDAGHWEEIFESPERDAWQKPDEVLRALALKPGHAVADLGAGTGYFTRRLAAAVGPDGSAIGLDLAPEMVERMNNDAAARGISNCEARVVTPDDLALAPGSLDVLFSCNVFHHIGDRPAYLRRIIPALRPGGRVVIVDFKPGELPVGPPPAQKVAPEQAIDEFRRAGYRLARAHDFLEYQYFLEFAPAGPEQARSSGAR